MQHVVSFWKNELKWIEMDNILLERKIKSGIKSAINEECRIADEVWKKSLYISGKIENRIQSKLEYNNTEHKGLRTATLSFNENLLWKENVSITVTVHNFFNVNIFNELFHTIDYNGASFSEDFLKINCYCISGTFKRKEAMETIQNEITLQHDAFIENFYLLTHGFNNLTKCSKDNPLYYIAELFGSQYDCNSLKYKFYSQLIKSKTIVPTWGDIKKTELYDYLVKLENAIDRVQTKLIDKKFCQNCEEFFKITIEALLINLKKIRNRAYRELVRTLMFIREEKVKGGFGCLYVGLKGELFLDIDIDAIINSEE